MSYDVRMMLCSALSPVCPRMSLLVHRVLKLILSTSELQWYLYLPSFPFFPLWCLDWEPFKSRGCLFISQISSAQHDSSSLTGWLWSLSTVQNNNHNSNNNIKLLFSSNVPFFWCFWSFYKALYFSNTTALYFSNNTVAYFICTALNWVMAMPRANLQKYRSYLPKAEADGEPAVLPFLFLFKDCTNPKFLNLGCEKPLSVMQTHKVCGSSWIKLMKSSSNSRKAAA